MSTIQTADLMPASPTEVISYLCATTVTAGDAVTADLTLSQAILAGPGTLMGVKTTPATGDTCFIGIALETVAGTSTSTKFVKVAVKGPVNKAKINTVVAYDPLVTDTTVGQLVKNTSTSSLSGVHAFALTATNTLLDGTTAAGFAGIYLI